MKTALAVALAVALTACAPKEIVYPLFGQEVPRLRELPADFKAPVSNETGEVIGGFGGDGGGVSHTPVIFVHGNTVSARFWLPAREYFKAAGYSGDELWAPAYGWNSVRAFDVDDLSVPTLDAFVTELQRYLSVKTGREIRQFDVIGHSLGVTVVRQWMQQTNKFHLVRNFIGVCGANHGIWTARPDARGQSRPVAFEVMPGSPWLEQLNRNGETPGPTRYMTLYDGTGWGDVLFPVPYENSSALKGAHNLAFNVQRNTHYDHLELPRQPDTMAAMIEFLRGAHEALPSEKPPAIVQEGALLHADQPDAQLRCAANGIYPALSAQPVAQAHLAEGVLLTCFARNERTQLSSPLARFKFSSAPPRGGPLTVTANPPPGDYENPQSVALAASDPDAYIVYTIAHAVPDSGSPLYQKPVYLAAAETLTAVAIAPDGRRSEPVTLRYNISIKVIDRNRSLSRQLGVEE